MADVRQELKRSIGPENGCCITYEFNRYPYQRHDVQSCLDLNFLCSSWGVSCQPRGAGSCPSVDIPQWTPYRSKVTQIQLLHEAAAAPRRTFLQ